MSKEISKGFYGVKRTLCRRNPGRRTLAYTVLYVPRGAQMRRSGDKLRVSKAYVVGSWACTTGEEVKTAWTYTALNPFRFYYNTGELVQPTHPFDRSNRSC